MKRIHLWLILTLIFPAAPLSSHAQQKATLPQVRMETTMGAVQIELYPDKAPQTVENFLSYVNSGFYDGTIFHRVIKAFMIQGGGFDASMKQKAGQPPIQNEADNGLKNLTGTIAMARTPDPHSATSQFFINVKDNGFLDHTGQSPNGWGYCVFGRVVDGMDIVHKIEAVATTQRDGHADVPVEPVIIKKASVVAP
jgi:peptidyl-prolyl cis-trans isomerase B (cyclophilin B)